MAVCPTVLPAITLKTAVYKYYSLSRPFKEIVGDIILTNAGTALILGAKKAKGSCRNLLFFFEFLLSTFQFSVCES
ncbi:hypothetical protein P378_04085 [Desulforamulus profundi]|uniref:Uncharacterized protein n=1 Tax=Desulforamulus profundi TaxID=1383067 RepID=A0A2C6L3T3_9FIRM|nr:hypothetical protein P378_04085 [Desulforamulus profundi]